MNWNDITVDQLQAVIKLQSTDMDEFDRLTEILAVIYKQTSSEIDELSLSEYGALARGIKFLVDEELPGKIKKFIQIGNQKYWLYCPQNKLTHRQHKEIKKFSDNAIENLHNILASTCMPVTWFLPRPNKAEHHARYAEDFKKAKVVDVYHACMFISKQYVTSQNVIADYLKRTSSDKAEGHRLSGVLKATADAISAEFLIKTKNI